MHISHDFIAIKTFPRYEFLVVFGQLQVWDRKSAGRGRQGLGWSVGRVRIRSVRGGSRQNFSNFCGCGAGLNFGGAGKKFQPAQDSSGYCVDNFPYFVVML